MDIDDVSKNSIISENNRMESIMASSDYSPSASKVILDDAQLQQIVKDIEIRNITYHNNLIIGVFIVILLAIWNLYHTSYVSLQDRIDNVRDRHDQAYISLLEKTGNDYIVLHEKYNELDKRTYKIEMKIESFTRPTNGAPEPPSSCLSCTTG